MIYVFSAIYLNYTDLYRYAFWSSHITYILTVTVLYKMYQAPAFAGLVVVLFHGMLSDCSQIFTVYFIKYYNKIALCLFLRRKALVHFTAGKMIL